jgi:hypothetical protein
MGSGHTFQEAVGHMWKLGGLPPFFKGISATVSRDAVFGCCYEVGRQYFAKTLPTGRFQKEEQIRFVANMLGAGLATIASSPFNYVRSIQYATAPDQIPRRAWPQLLRLWENARKQPSTVSYLGQRLRIGWGTLRVAVGMALAQYLFHKWRGD